MMRGVLIVLAVLAAAYGAALVWPGPEPVSHPWLDGRTAERAERIAHGGGLGRAPANTIAALEQAVADGADVLEVDLQMTADGYLVLLHDDSVDRTTNGTGRIDALRLNDVTALDAAFGYEGEPADRFAGQGITIPFVYHAFAAFPDMRWIVEIKPQTEDAAMATCMAITETDMGHPGFANRVLVGSFHDDVLHHFREVCPGIATGMASNEALSFYVMARLGLAKFHPTRAVAAQLPPRASGLDVIHPRLVDAAHARGLAVQVWTINDPDEMEALIARGVDGIITDRIDVMADLQGE
ncbi:glycerophosphodiester phosphodiesterase [Glycocaulis abyssi]|uniref:Glycerophosphodiester phosphodiesterase n=1 Tax=Glycocaulis abyssi TaxID=1433403 RepID=A0ABV9NF56_9PROT